MKEFLDRSAWKRLLLTLLIFLASTAGSSIVAAQSTAGIRTEKTGYLAGELIGISGQGFSPYEHVQLFVTHDDGKVEIGAGHEAIVVSADSGGAFQTQWSISRIDVGGTQFKITAQGFSGSTAQMEFVRVGRIITDKTSYARGDTVQVAAEGFNPDELVTFQLNDVHDHDLPGVVTDENGNAVAEIKLPVDNPDATVFRISATSIRSSIVTALYLRADTLQISPPALTGRIVYHSYVSYDDGTSQLFILNLATGSLTNISRSWTNLKDPMNAPWSPDGTKIVFMGRPKKGSSYSAWFDIFLYTVGKSGNPVDLTNRASRNDEDPKFSPDGTRIVYKLRPSTLLEMDLNGNILNTIVSSSGYERSTPQYTADGTAVWFAQQPAGGDGSLTAIHRINLNGSDDSVVVDTPGVLDYYPIRDTVGQFLYSRWVSPSNLHSQVYVYDGVNSSSPSFNTLDADYSDACPINAQFIVLSSTKAGGQGTYDLYIVDRTTGAMWSLNQYNGSVNTARQELGSSYTPTN